MDRFRLLLPTCTLVALAWGVLPPGAAAQAGDAASRVDAVFSRWDSTTTPGCAVGVSQGGATVLERAYGMAELEHGIANTPQTIFENGSVSKQFTAAAVVLLAMDGKLSLEDDVRRYVPELPDYGHTIRLRHLLTHTSGLRDWGNVAQISGWGRSDRTHNHAHVLDILSRQTALNYEPGHQYSYTNSGYNLLAVIVARVSGMSFADFSMERVFRPLGLDHTQWRDDHRRIVPGRSSAYNATRDGWEINRPVEYVHGNGGILTTVGDLLRWNRALTEERFGPEFSRLMYRKGRLNDGSEIVYAGGLRLEEVMGVRSISHTGSTAGYRAFTARYPDQGLAVAMLCNASNAPTGGNGTRVARVFLGNAASDPVAPEGVPVPRSALERFVGLYREPVTGNTTEIRMDGDRLMTGGTPLIPLSGTRFQLGARERWFDFHDADSGRPWFNDDLWEYSDERYERVVPWTPGPDDLGAFTGVYRSDEAETTYRVHVEDGKLTVTRRPGVSFTLEPIYQDGFRGGWRIVRFHRAAGQPASELSLSIGRVYDMRFQRIGDH